MMPDPLDSRLLHATRDGDVGDALAWLDEGAGMEARDRDGWTPPPISAAPPAAPVAKAPQGVLFEDETV